MKRLVRLLRHARALWRVRMLEIRLNDLMSQADCSINDELRVEISIRRRMYSRELVHARIRLNEFSKPGDRRTWTIA